MHVWEARNANKRVIFLPSALGGPLTRPPVTLRPPDRDCCTHTGRAGATIFIRRQNSHVVKKERSPEFAEMGFASTRRRVDGVASHGLGEAQRAVNAFA